MKRTYRKNKENKIKNIILEYVSDNAKTYLILLIIFFIGIILGILFVNNAGETQTEQISSYINNFINGIKENYQISRTKLLTTSVINNLCITILLWFLGSTVIGVPIIYLVIGYRGYCVGYTISSVIATIGTGKGIVFITSTMLLQNIIYIPAILTLAVSGIKLYRLIIEDRRKENIKIQILKHTIFCALIFVILLISSLIETYISGSLASVLLKYC
ncbi:MAG: stage II sporulation protein M [Clostridia bacterium]